MNKLLSSTVLFVLVLESSGCSKDTGGNRATVRETTFSFKGNSVLVEWNGATAPGASTVGALIQRHPNNASADATYYTLYASPGGAGIASPQIAFRIKTQHLAVGRYTSATMSTIADWTKAENFCIMPASGYPYYASTEVGDYVSVEITSIQDGYADGTFTGLMTNSPQSSLDKLQITDGVFKHVQIFQ